MELVVYGKGRCWGTPYRSPPPPSFPRPAPHPSQLLPPAASLPASTPVLNGWKYFSSTRGQDPHVERMCTGSCAPECQCNTYRCDGTCTTISRCVRVSALSGGEVFGLVSTECLSADKDPSSPHRDSGVRFQPVPEGRITAPVMGSFTAGAAPGFPRGRGFGWDRAKTPAYNYQVCSRRDALRSSPSSATL